MWNEEKLYRVPKESSWIIIHTKNPIYEIDPGNLEPTPIGVFSSSMLMASLFIKLLWPCFSVVISYNCSLWCFKDFYRSKFSFFRVVNSRLLSIFSYLLVLSSFYASSTSYFMSVKNRSWYKECISPIVLYELFKWLIVLLPKESTMTEGYIEL